MADAPRPSRVLALKIPLPDPVLVQEQFKNMEILTPPFDAGIYFTLYMKVGEPHKSFQKHFSEPTHLVLEGSCGKSEEFEKSYNSGIFNAEFWSTGQQDPQTQLININK